MPGRVSAPAGLAQAWYPEGQITINGGTVTANGGIVLGVDPEGGGAGIGSGGIATQPWCSLITIKITGGDNGFVSNVYIGGDAQVLAQATGAAAGIGAGREYSTARSYCNSGIIEIKDQADVTAFGGYGAQAVGVGSAYVYRAVCI